MITDSQQVYYFMFEVVPDAEGDNFVNYGGAFVACWVRGETVEDAQDIAINAISTDGWAIKSIEESFIAEHEFYADEPELRSAYEQALSEGESYIYYTWTPEPQEEDTIH